MRLCEDIKKILCWHPWQAPPLIYRNLYKHFVRVKDFIATDPLGTNTIYKLDRVLRLYTISDQVPSDDPEIVLFRDDALAAKDTCNQQFCTQTLSTLLHRPCRLCPR